MLETSFKDAYPMHAVPDRAMFDLNRKKWLRFEEIFLKKIRAPIHISKMNIIFSTSFDVTKLSWHIKKTVQFEDGWSILPILYV